MQLCSQKTHPFHNTVQNYQEVNLSTEEKYCYISKMALIKDDAYIERKDCKAPCPSLLSQAATLCNSFTKGPEP